MKQDTDTEPSSRQGSSTEDNYFEYLRDEYGYSYRYSEIKTSRQLAEHSDIKNRDTEEFPDSSELDEWSDFERWGLAKAAMRVESLQTLEATVQKTLDSDEEDRGLNYREISISSILYFIEHGAEKRAERFISEHRQRWEGDLEGLQLEGIYEELFNENSDQLDRLSSQNAADPELHIDIAEIFVQIGESTLARDWLSRARETVSDLESEPAIVDIEILEQRLKEGRAEAS